MFSLLLPYYQLFVLLFAFFFFSGKMVFLQKRHPTPFSPPVEVFKVTNCISLPKINNLLVLLVKRNMKPGVYTQ